VLLQVHLADDLIVAGPAEGLPIVVARQLVVLARSVLVARAVWGGPVTLHLTVPPEDKEALGVVDEDPVAALTHGELAQVLCARAASGAARVYRAVGDGHLLDVANGKDLGAVLHGGKGVVTVIIIHVEVELLIHILAPLLMGLDEPA